MRWTLLPLHATARPGWWHMALDQALLDEAERTGEGFLRCYQWDPACLSFGRHEPALRRYDRERILALGLATVRRPTGGRAVWHALECTYAVAAPVKRFGSLRDTYRIIHSTIATALQRLGAPAVLAGPGQTAGLGSGACFAAAAGGEVLLGNRKVAGSAQLQQGTACLQHGSILLGGGQGLVAEVTRGAAPPVNDVSLGDRLGRTVTFEEVAGALHEAAREWPGEWHRGEAEWSERLARRHAGHFQDPAWTWRR